MQNIKCGYQKIFLSGIFLKKYHWEFELRIKNANDGYQRQEKKFSLPNFILLYKFWNNLPDLDFQFNYI